MPAHLRNERNVSPHTLRNYLSDLAQFQNFLVAREQALDGDGGVDAGKVDIHVVRAYLASLAPDRKKSSIGRKLAALKGFFRYLVTTKRLGKDPLLLINSPKQEKPLPKFLTVDDAFHLLDTIKLESGLDQRDRAVLEVFYSTGIRVSELVGLHWSDIDVQLGIIRVVGKGAKERIVPIGAVALKALESYADSVRSAVAGRLPRRNAGVSQSSRPAHHHAQRRAHRRETFAAGGHPDQNGSPWFAP